MAIYQIAGLADRFVVRFQLAAYYSPAAKKKWHSVGMGRGDGGRNIIHNR